MTFSKRLYLGLTLFLLVAVACRLVNNALVTQLHRAAMYSGCALLLVLLVLTFFNARKKLPFLPLLKASTWMQIHIYVGLLSVVLFGLHLRGRIPHGAFEFTLATLYLAVALSGFAGLAISHWLPPRLTAHGENLIYERIPALRTQVRQQVEGLVEQSLTTTQSSTIADFYVARLRSFFVLPRRMWAHWLGSRESLSSVMAETEALDQFLNTAEREIMSQIIGLIYTKHNLDVQFAGQRVLKLWLFIHIPLTYALLLFAIVHGILAFTLS